jgi:hypothetical protein
MKAAHALLGPKKIKTRLRIGGVFGGFFLLASIASQVLSIPALIYVGVPLAFISFYLIFFRVVFRNMGRREYRLRFNDCQKNRANKVALFRFLLDLDDEIKDV